MCVCVSWGKRAGESIYGEKFADEWDKGYIKHSVPGMLSMANAGQCTLHCGFARRPIAAEFSTGTPPTQHRCYVSRGSWFCDSSRQS